MISIRNATSRWLTSIPVFHTKEKTDSPEILDISQGDELDDLDGLKNRIVEGLFQASPGKRQIPIEVMYQGDGADLYATAASSPGYYLHQAERQIIKTHAKEIASYIADRTDIIELGAGSLEKTQVLLQAVAQAPQIVSGIDYYALDINREALVESLASLSPLQGIKYRGLFGTYNNGLHHIASLRLRRDVKSVPRVFMWLGSGIENMPPETAVEMVKSITNVMVDGDMMLVGMDGWASSDASIDGAYECLEKLVLNTLKNVNEILGESMFDKSKFVYSTQVNRLGGRNECCSMASEAIDLNCGGKSVRMEQGERILVVPSYKYTDNQVTDTVKSTGCLEAVQRFGTPSDADVQYGVWLWRKVTHQ
ncbi:hypothetical protein EMPS_01409 [Entomortierella parvispora]|uniref:4-dimethylallyltryptophan N-methyltransferase n=1 Tax=Entomortierella parvispora TaxID=205924 RepID=A0A9P3H2T9_9FUNG|nr:hypothetical protein EMPS_01409 [Entomortierella parvispora]